MTSATSNPQMRVLIQNIKTDQSNENKELPSPSRHRHDEVMPDKIRLDKKRKEYIPPIPAELLSDYLKVRKAKRAGDLTETAFNGIEREAKLANLSTEEAVKICCERGWGGFKASWLQIEAVKTIDKPAQRWDATLEGVMAKGRELGILPKPGETEGQYRERVKAA